MVLVPAALFTLAFLFIMFLSSSSLREFVNTLETADNIALTIEVVGIILLIIEIVAIWKLLSGWSLVKNNPPEETTIS